MSQRRRPGKQTLRKFSNLRLTLLESQVTRRLARRSSRGDKYSATFYKFFKLSIRIERDSFDSRQDDNLVLVLSESKRSILYCSDLLE